MILQTTLHWRQQIRVLILSHGFGSFCHVLHLNAGLDRLRNKDWFPLEQTPSFCTTIYVYIVLQWRHMSHIFVKSRATPVYVQPLSGEHQRRNQSSVLMALWEENPPVNSGSCYRGPVTRKYFHLHILPARISNYIHHKKWDEITYPSPFNNFKAWEWISNFIMYLLGMRLLIHVWACINDVTAYTSLDHHRQNDSLMANISEG